MTDKLRDFHIADIITAGTGTLVSLRGMDGVYDILNYMTGDNLFTHQIPRATWECMPYLIAQFPWLAEIDSSGATPDNHKEWVRGVVNLYGEMHAVEPLPHDEHERIDPFSELAEKIHPDKIVLVKT